MRKTFLFLILLMIAVLYRAECQQWGLYTFYSPQNSTTAYLVDTNGTTYKSWTGLTGRTGYSAYLIPGDTIFRSISHTGNSLNGGGMTGEVQKLTWNGTVAWNFVYSSTTYCLHHDICALPNGHVLLICYDVKTSAQAIQAGASSSTSVWSESILEVRPTGPTTGEIVWRWNLWDHLCQNYNSSKDNYVTSLLDNPQLMNINVGTSQDRFHMNGIDYNPVLDQIAVSMHFTNEAYIIDHSTTTSEAAGHTGGRSGKGGDFLYRWGKPANYGATGTTIFNVLHDAHWIPSDNPSYPNYLCAFNNKGGTGGKSAFTIWNPPYNGYNYTWNTGQAYTPSTYAYQYSSSYTANDLGNSQQLPNGNSLMCIPSNPGTIIEVSPTGTVLWTKSSSSAHAYRYSLCYVRGPVASAGASATTVAAGTPVTLNSSATSVTETSPSYSYSWSSAPSGFSSSDQNPLVTPSSTTTYLVTVTNTALGCWDTAHITVNVSGGSTLTVNATADPTEICEGDDVQLNAVPSGGTTYSYEWSSDPSGFTSNLQNPTVAPSSTTSYYVTVTSGGNTATSATTVMVHPLPNVPVINQTDNTLFSSSSTGNQWYFNGGIMNGENGQSLSATQSGTYTVVVTDTYGCTSESDVYNFIYTGIHENYGRNISVFPNPASGLIHIQDLTDIAGEYQLLLVNSIGEIILEKKNENSIDLSKYHEGIYFLFVKCSDGYTLKKKVILMK